MNYRISIDYSLCYSLDYSRNFEVIPQDGRFDVMCMGSNMGQSIGRYKILYF